MTASQTDLIVKIRSLKAMFMNSECDMIPPEVKTLVQDMNKRLIDSMHKCSIFYIEDRKIWRTTIYVEVEEGSKWTLTADSYITSLTCSADSIDLNGHKLYVNGVEYTASTASQGEAIVVELSSSAHGDRPEMSNDGGKDHKPGDGKQPPEKPQH